MAWYRGNFACAIALHCRKSKPGLLCRVTTLFEAAKRREDELYLLAREPLHRGERPRMVPLQVLQYIH